MSLTRALHHYEKLDGDAREQFVPPFTRFCWPAFVWAVLRGSVDFPFTFSLGAFLALLTYAAIFFQAAMHVGSTAVRLAR